MPPAGLFRVHLDAQIDTAQNFQYSHLRINYMLKLPTGTIIFKKCATIQLKTVQKIIDQRLLTEFGF